MKMQLKKKIGGKKKYYTILFSYLLILVIPLICGAFLHIYNKKLVTKQAEDMTERMLTNIREQTDSFMENIWQMALIASQMEPIDKVLSIDPSQSADTAYQLYRVGQELQKYYSFDHSIKDVFVYFKKLDKIAGGQGVLDSDMYRNLYLGETVSSDQFRKLLNEFRYKECVKIENKKGGEDVLCAVEDPENIRSKTPEYVVVVVFEEETMKKMLKSLQWMDSTAVLIQDRDGRMLFETEGFADKESLSLVTNIEDTKNSYRELELEGVKYAVMVEESAKTQWKYYMLTPIAVIEKNANEMQKYYFFMLFGCIAVGFAIAGALSKRHYHPIKILSDLIMQFKFLNHTEPDKQNEDNYQWFQEQMDSFFRERVNTMKILKQNKRELKNYYLLRLLENSYTADLDENLQKNQIIFAHPWYAVIQFIIDSRENNVEEHVLVQFILKNIFTELMEESGSFLVYMVHVGERIVGIANFGDRRQMEQIRDIIQRTQEIIEGKFNYEVTALLGDCYNSRSEIFKSYGDTCEMEEYISLLDDTLICYEDVHERDQKYRYNAELDQKLFNAVKAGNKKIALEQLDLVLGQYCSKEMSVNVYRCLVFDMLGTILKAADAGGYHDAGEKTDVMEQLSDRFSINQAEAMLQALIENVCGKILEMQQDTGRDMELIRKVQEYIQENFRNPDINVSQTGQYFHMTPSYLSAIYKKQTGNSLLEALNQIRLQEAERLLEQGMSVVEVAERAGFRDSTYLIRVFKKKMGITPGQKKMKL